MESRLGQYARQFLFRLPNIRKYKFQIYNIHQKHDLYRLFMAFLAKRHPEALQESPMLLIDILQANLEEQMAKAERQSYNPSRRKTFSVRRSKSRGPRRRHTIEY